MKSGRLVALIAGSVLMLPAVGAILGGGALALGYAFGRTAAGEFELSVPELTTTASAITADGSVLVTDIGTPAWLAEMFDADVRLAVTPLDPGQRIFVGVGGREPVDSYLRGVAHDTITGLTDGEPVYNRESGEAVASPPAEQRLWSVSATGLGTQEIRYEALGEIRTLVVMNADGSAGIGATAVLAVTAPFVLPLSLAVLVTGLLVAALAGLLIRWGTRGRPRNPGRPTRGYGSVPTPRRTATHEHPVHLEARMDEDLSRWQWLIKWVLAVPHLIVLALLWPAFLVMTIIAGLSILFTGVYPRSLFDFTSGVLRWTCRVSYYAFHGGMGTDRYPPFSLGAEPDYPITLDIHYPDHLSSGLVLVKWWLLALPQYVVVALLVGDWFGWTGTDDFLPSFGALGSVGALGILVIAAGIVLLVTGAYPRSLFDLVIGLNRWIFRVAAYATLMTDVYPPFRLDQGGGEPEPAPPTGAPLDEPRRTEPVVPVGSTR